jgi:hypothetical protein
MTRRRLPASLFVLLGILVIPAIVDACLSRLDAEKHAVKTRGEIATDTRAGRRR